MGQALTVAYADHFADASRLGQADCLMNALFAAAAGNIGLRYAYGQDDHEHAQMELFSRISHLINHLMVYYAET